MVSQWCEKLTPSGWQTKAQKMHISTDIRQKMTPSWGAKSGSWESPKMRPKIIKKLTFDTFLGHFWAPQGGCRSKHLKKRVIFWGQTELVKINRNVQKWTPFWVPSNVTP